MVECGRILMIKQFVFGNRIGIVQRGRKNASKRLSKAIFLFTVALPHMVFAATYYVAPSGSDSNPGAASQPWRTITKANSALQPGDTVFIHAGTYNNQIRPARSGTSNSNRITYQAYGDGDVTLTWTETGQGVSKGAIALGGRDYITVNGAGPDDSDGVRRIKHRPTGKMSVYGQACGSEGTIVKNIEFGRRGDNGKVASRGWGLCVNFWSGSFTSRYNVFAYNAIYGEHDASKVWETEDLINVSKDSDYNLFEHNIVDSASHDAFYISDTDASNNVIRNNIISNDYHTACSHWHGGGNTLWESNECRGSGDFPTTSAGASNAFQLSAPQNILRYNVIHKGGASDYKSRSLGGVKVTSGTSGGVSDATGNHIYNNTLVKSRSHSYGMQYVSNNFYDVGNNRLVNNILYGNPSDSVVARYIGTNGIPKGVRDKWFTNMIGSNKSSVIITAPDNGSMTAAQAELLVGPKYPEFSDIVQMDPQFSDYNRGDYTLKETSGLIDRGRNLTNVASSDSGSGSSLIVEDAGYFFDASGFPSWMEVRSDWIAVGSDLAGSEKVQIVSIDYSNNKIVLSRIIGRGAGDRVWLWKDSDGSSAVAGAAPDIGAFEYLGAGAGIAPPSPPNNVRVN